MTPELSAILKSLILPPGINLLLLLSGLFLINVHKKTAYFLLLFSVMTLYLSSAPIVSRNLAATIEPKQGLSVESEADSSGKAIVILGCGRYAKPLEYPEDDVSPCALTRLRYAAEIQPLLSLPILITGGSVFGEAKAESTIMREVLNNKFGISAKWVEPDSRNTIENAAYSAEILRKKNIDTIYLVTHAMHMRRASWLFKKQGFKVVPAPTYFHSSGSYAPLYLSVLPSAHALNTTNMVLKEYLGIIWQKLTVR